MVAALGAAQVASWGVLYYAFAVFLPAMRTDLGLSIAELTGAFSLALATSAIAGLGVGRWLDRGGSRALMTLGSLLAALLVVAWSRVDSLAELYLVFAGIGIAMAAVLYEPAFIVVAKSFRSRRREALTVLTLIAALASLIFSPLSERLISAFGWRDALLLLAALLAATTVPLHAFFLRGAARASATPARAGGGDPAQGGTRQRLPGFRLLTGAFILVTLASAAIAVLLVTLLIGRGHGPGFAALAAGVVGVSQIPGRILFAIVGRWLSAGGLATAAFALMTASLVLLAVADAAWAALAFAASFGIGAGMSTLLRAALIAELYGSMRYGRNSSIVAAFVTGARAAAPLIAGAAVTLAGGYTELLWALAGATAVAAVAAHRAVREAGGVSPPPPGWGRIALGRTHAATADPSDRPHPRLGAQPDPRPRAEGGHGRRDRGRERRPGRLDLSPIRLRG